MQIRKIIIKPLSLFSILFIGTLAEANDYVIGKGYLIPPGVVYCDANAIENQVEFLAAGIKKRVGGCYVTAISNNAKMLKDYPDRGFSVWVFLDGDSYYKAYLPNALLK
ncbi:hypothetical protein L2K20_30750 [Mycobacterium sp. MBM]|jgi:hypothetical protein|nr:hypothetical protein [Mycobacterium sp. MBM]